jgi:N-acetylmuramoyl-L-alanine amidase
MNNDGKIRYLIKFALICVAFMALVFAFGGISKHILTLVKSDTYAPVFDDSNKITYVIDAGHGGEDAGASSDTGVLEKTVNLEVSKILKALYILNGNEVKMTREDDTLLYDYYGDLSDYTGKKKVYDLKNRVKITNECENPVYIGIHMNKFSQPKYSGAQVYYSKNNTSSAILANSIQESIKKNLQPKNNRTVKRADSSIFVLDNLECPSVLIECGFLSNPQETEFLISDEYQARLAVSIFVATLAHPFVDN